jgi:hypothetical protein
MKWSRDGSQLYYISDNRLIVVSVALSPELVVGEARKVFDIPESISLGWGYGWDLSADGTRFLMMQDVEQEDEDLESAREPLSIFLIENWYLEYQSEG